MGLKVNKKQTIVIIIIVVTKTKNHSNMELCYNVRVDIEQDAITPKKKYTTRDVSFRRLGLPQEVLVYNKGIVLYYRQ